MSASTDALAMTAAMDTGGSSDFAQLAVAAAVEAGEFVSSPGTSAYSAGRRALLDSSGSTRDTESFSVESPGSQGRRVASRQLFLAVFVCCFSPLLFGFSLCFTSPAQGSMEGKAKDGVAPPSDLTVFTPTQFTYYAALFNIGAVAGAFAGSSMMNRIGRRRALALSACPHVIAWLGTSLSSDALLLTSLRILTGFSVGMGTAVTPCYIGEVAPPSLRGPLGAVNQLSLTSGIFLVNLAGSYGTVAESQGHSFCDWRALAAVGAALAAVLSTMVCMPESPRWLAQRGQVQAAKLALRRLRQGDTAAEEAELEVAAEEQGPSSGGSLGYKLSDCKRSLVVAVGLLFFLQFSGINAIMMYATDICAQAGMENAEFSTVLVMIAQLVFGVLSCALVETFGRRCLLQFSGLTMCLSHLGLSYYYWAHGAAWWAPPPLALFSLSLYVIGFSVGMGPVPWIILGEIFPVEVAGQASAIATAVGWASSFAVCVGFRDLQLTVGAGGAFMFFALLCFGCYLFVTSLVPETNGKTLDEILRLMRCGGAREAPAAAAGKLQGAAARVLV